MPDPSWFEDIHSKNPKPFRRRGPTKPGECQGAFVYKEGSVQAMVDEHVAAGWELVSKTPCQLGTALQFRGPEKKPEA
jgi:hypothetical protein